MLTSDQIKKKIESYLFDNLAEWKEKINQLSSSDSQKKVFRQFVVEDLNKKSKLILALIDHLMGYTNEYDKQSQILLETITLLECVSNMTEKTISTDLSKDQQSQLEKLNSILSEVPATHVTSSVE